MAKQETKDIDPFRIIGPVFTGVATLMLALGGWFFWRDQKMAKESVHISGVVSRLEYNNEGLAAPVIEYRVNGKKRFLVGTVWSSPPSYDEGETVQLLVNKQDDSKVILDEFFDRYFIVGIFGFLAMVFGAIGVGMLVFSGKSF